MNACRSGRPYEVSPGRVRLPPGACKPCLPALGHDVVSALERNPRATDDELLALATEERRVIITEDKDFGEIAFVRRLPHPCIIRFVNMRVAEKVTAMKDLIESHPEAMQDGNLIVVTQSRVRIRRAQSSEQGGV